MEQLQQFNAQWHGISKVVLSEAKRQLNTIGKVDSSELTDKLRAETSKWQLGILAQGLWYKTFLEHSPGKANLFIEKASEQFLMEPANCKRPSSGWVYTILIAVVVAIGYFLHKVTNLSVVEQLFYPVLLFVIMRTLYEPIKSRRIAAYERLVLDDINRQLDSMRRQLEIFIV